MRIITTLAFSLMTALPAGAGDWVVSVATGPFVFGNFAESRDRLSVGEGDVTVHHSLSAATRAGALVQGEYKATERWSVRLESTFTRSPMSIKTSSDSDDPDGEGLELTIGDLNVVTFAATIAYHFNAGSNLEPYVAVGPAYAIYDLEPDRDSGSDPLFEGSRGRIGGLAALGLDWWWKPRWRLRAEIADIITPSPLKRSDFGSPSPASLDIRSPHNVHTSFGVGYRF